MLRRYAVLLPVFGALSWSSIDGQAQSLNELPGPVAGMAKSFIAQCRSIGGKPRYEPLNYVTAILFGPDLHAGGLASFLVDTSRIACVDSNGKRRQPWCEASGCPVWLFTPEGARGWNRTGFRDIAWRIVGPGGPDGPHALLETSKGGLSATYTAAPGGVRRVR